MPRLRHGDNKASREDTDMAVSPEFPYESKFVEVHGSRMHYVEKGAGRVFLFLHGNPTWSYLWRNVIPGVSSVGRCIAFDLVGFGRSARPKIGYTFLEHYEYVEGFIDALELRDVVLVGHDWGGALGFYYAMNRPENVKGIAFFETFAGTFTWSDFPPEFRLGFRMFRTPLLGQFLIMVLNVFVEKILPKSVHGGLSKEIHGNYRKMFPTVMSRYPVYVWPNEIPMEGRENETFRIFRLLEKALPDFDCPMLLLTATPGAIIRPGRESWFHERVKDLTVRDVGGGIHYLQEDNPEGIAREIVDWAIMKGLA